MLIREGTLCLFNPSAPYISCQIYFQQAKVEALRDRYDAIILKRERREEMRIMEERLAIKREAAAVHIQVSYNPFDEIAENINAV